MLRSEERDSSRVSLLFARTAENSSTAILSAIAKTFLTLPRIVSLSTIQVGGQSIETRWTVSVGVDFLRFQASMIINLLHEGEAREWCFYYPGPRGFS